MFSNRLSRRHCVLLAVATLLLVLVLTDTVAAADVGETVVDCGEGNSTTGCN